MKPLLICKSTDKKPDATGKLQFYPEQFKIDVSVCMSCQICVEVCPFDAIKMDTTFELSTQDRFDDLLWPKQRLAKSNEYYHSIHPTEAAAVDAELAAARAKAAPKPPAAAAPTSAATPAPAVPVAPAPATDAVKGSAT